MEKATEKDIFARLSAHAKKSLEEARRIAAERGSSSVDCAHALLAITAQRGSVGASLLGALGISDMLILEELGSGGAPAQAPETFSPFLAKALTRAWALAESLGYPYVGSEHLALAVLETKDPFVSALIVKAKVSGEMLSSAVGPYAGRLPFAQGGAETPFASGPFAPGQLGPEIGAIEEFCIDLGRQVEKKGERTIGREKEIARIADILGRKTKNNPLLLGDPGVGKTAIVSGLAERIGRGKVSAALLGKKIYALDLALLVAGTTFRGEFEQRLKEVIEEASERSDVILFVDEAHSLVGAGNPHGALDAANILKPALARGDIRLIGATTFAEYKKYIEKDPALARRFQTVTVKEPSRDETLVLLKALRSDYEKHHGVDISDGALEAAVDMSVRYVFERFLPDKALDALDEAASGVRGSLGADPLSAKIIRLKAKLSAFEKRKKEMVEKGEYDEAIKDIRKEKELVERIGKLEKEVAEKASLHLAEVTEKDVARAVARIADIPLADVSLSGAAFGNLEKRLRAKVFGQKEAVKTIAGILLRSASGLADPDRPLGSFLLVGPSGSGKTFLAKTLAQEVFGTAKALIRIDMADMGEKHTVSKLVGAPAGYVGYEEGGRLVEMIRRAPQSVILFDEVDKAHPDVLGILLSMLEEGKLQDSEGRGASVKDAIIILSANSGGIEGVQASLGFGSAKEKGSAKRTEAALARQLRGELISRLDKVITLNALDEDALRLIAQRELARLKAKALKQALKISFGKGVAALLATRALERGGARAVDSLVRELVEMELAAHILAGKKVFSVKVSSRGKGLEFSAR